MTVRIDNCGVRERERTRMGEKRRIDEYKN